MWVREEKEPDAQSGREVGEQRRGRGQDRGSKEGGRNGGWCRDRWRHTDLRDPETKGKEFAWRQKNWD